ncbi:PIN domain-containing protein [Rhodohalobacter sp. SW132]|uniref:type II toxin-antitoxin system VapC family toxin n=1 Tax=Rhodohalobacter sp. SW132 TaxID=2293433 RepID=UPI000E26B67E|nr:PIN domain-containing protein [Rhodohalobacter sp. SW132]REL24932.1 PIN domain-containing protein [Rhodohalobacter sp. SW132]
MINTLIDAGPIIALFDKSDQHHERVLGFMKAFEGKLVSTWPVLSEVCYMLDFNRETQLDFLEWVVQGGIDVHNLEQWQLNRIRHRIETYSDLPADLADCTLIDVAETERLNAIITLDRDFTVYKLENGQFLENLLN